MTEKTPTPKTPTPKTSGSVSRFPLSTRWRRALGFTAAGVAVYGGVAGLLLPQLLRARIETYASETLQRQAQIGALRFNPFTLKLGLKDATLSAWRSDAPFARIGSAEANLAGWSSLFHLAPVVQSLRIADVELHLARTAPNRYNIDDLLALAAQQPPSPEPARFAVHNIEIGDANITFDDQPESTRHEVRALRLGLPFLSSLPADVELNVEPHLSAVVDGAPFRLDGRARPYAEPREATLDLKLEALDLARFGEYLPVSLPFRLAAGKLDLQLSAAFVQPREQAARVTLEGRAALAGLRLADAKGKTLLSLPAADAVLEKSPLLAGRVALGRVSLRGLDAALQRDAQGRFNLQPAVSASATTPPAPAAPAAATAPAFQLTLKEFALRDATLRYSDPALRAELLRGDLLLRSLRADGEKRRVEIGELRSDGSALALQLLALPAPPAAGAEDKAAPWSVALSQVNLARWALRAEDRRAAQPAVLEARDLSLTLGGYATDGRTPATLALAAVLNRGRLGVNGTLTPQPFAADLRLEAEGIDVAAAQAYLAGRMQARLLRAGLTLRGRVEVKEGAAAYQGEAALVNVGFADGSGSEFLRWTRLNAGAIEARSAPLALRVGQLSLRDFFARVVILPDGRLNLQNLFLAQGAPAPATAAPAPAPAAAPLPIAIDKLTLDGGRVRFSDRFIKPNYNATLDALGGSVNGLSSDPATRAQVELHGEVNDAPLTIGGSINPLAGDLAFDIQAAVRGMELAPLSAYAGRYVGYAIERGKLSFDVSYRLAQRQLTAQNRLVLDQLRFGEASTDPDARSLPVHFALALLQDSKGVVDVNLPIEGSLDDPQFSISGIVLRMIGNLVTKVVTAPFSALASLFGGHGEELSQLDFEPGRAVVPAKGSDALDKLARALRERPALQVEITGRSEADKDIPGLRRALLERKLRALKQRDLQARGQAVDLATLQVTPAEYPALLARVYAAENFAKPKNVLGLEKSLPPAEMERLLLASIPVGDDELRTLANRRAEAAKEYLQKAGVPAERLYLIGGKPGAVRAEFSLK